MILMKMSGKKLDFERKMNSLFIKIEELNSRVTIIRKLLRPLRMYEVPCFLRPAPQYQGQVIAASQRLEVGFYYDKWQFDTYVKDFWCQYHELWLPFAKTGTSFLEKAYLNILRLNSEHKFENNFCSLLSSRTKMFVPKRSSFTYTKS